MTLPPTGLRVMYWPNEPAHLYPAFTQAGGRAAFAAMLADGTIAALDIYSQRVERARHATAAQFEDAARQAIAAFAPDVLFVQHLAGTDVSEDFWKRLRRERPQVTLVYHEGDAYDQVIKRFDQPIRSVLRHADLVLGCGLGTLSAHLTRYTKNPVGYLPHCFVQSRFATIQPDIAAKKYDIVMIGNSGRLNKLKFLHVPGGRRRAQLATTLSRIYGPRFALFGAGWAHLAAARGSLPFFQQEEALQSGRITANWDHFDKIAYYYSDRLPISLAAGVPHVTSWHAGYDHLFAGCPGLYACKTVPEAVETCRWLLSRPDEDLLAEGLAAREWACDRMEANVVFRHGMAQATAAHRRRAVER